MSPFLESIIEEVFDIFIAAVEVDFFHFVKLLCLCLYLNLIGKLIQVLKRFIGKIISREKTGKKWPGFQLAFTQKENHKLYVKMHKTRGNR